MVPVVHDDAHTGAVVDGLLQLGVGSRDVLENHRDVVLVAPAGALHHDGGPDRDGRDDDVGEEQVFGASGELVDPQQRQVLGGDQLEEIQHDLRGEVFLGVRWRTERGCTLARSM